MSKWKNWKKRLKTAEGHRAVVFLIAGILISSGLYFGNYNIPGTEQGIERGVEEYLRFDVQILDQVKEGRGMVVTFVTEAEDGDKPNMGGTVTLKRGINFLWLPMNASYSNLHDVVSTKPFSDYRMIKPEEHAVLYVLDCPEGIASWEMDYYDPVAYNSSGDINLLTMEGEITEKHFVRYIEDPINWNYIHEVRCYDRDGNQMDGTYSDRPRAEDGGFSKGTAEVGLWDAICGFILLAGFLISRGLWVSAGVVIGDET